MHLSTFRETIESGQFAVAAELTVQRDSTADDLRRQADLLVSVADGIEVTDNPYAWVQMSALSAAGILREHGADPIPVLTWSSRACSASITACRFSGTTCPACTS